MSRRCVRTGASLAFAGCSSGSTTPAFRLVIPRLLWTASVLRPASSGRDHMRELPSGDAAGAGTRSLAQNVREDNENLSESVGHSLGPVRCSALDSPSLPCRARSGRQMETVIGRLQEYLAPSVTWDSQRRLLWMAMFELATTRLPIAGRCRVVNRRQSGPASSCGRLGYEGGQLPCCQGGMFLA